MRERRFSAGPWRAIITRRKKHSPTAIISTGVGICIDATGSGETWAESVANAHAIAAIPIAFDALIAAEAALAQVAKKCRDDLTDATEESIFRAPLLAVREAINAMNGGG